MTRTMIVGARGQLGRDLVSIFQQDGDVLEFDLPELDLANRALVDRLADLPAPNLIINAAAYTDVEGAETHRDAAFAANEIGARHGAELAARLDVPIVYYSTDFVFDGSQRTPYRPGDPLRPLSVYGLSKAAGEAAVRAAQPKHFIIRTAWLYGPGGNNFVEKILRAAQTRPCLQVVDDEFGSPTHTWDLAEATRRLTATRAYGDYHVVNSGVCSRFEWAVEILRLAGLQTPVSPCRAADWPSQAPRPAYAALDVGAFADVTGQTPRPWTEALRHYLQRRENGS